MRRATGRIGQVSVPGSVRPLDENVDAAIVNATWRLLLEEGYARMSIARVAGTAGMGRPAIYRRYRDKSELVAAVIADNSGPERRRQRAGSATSST